MDRDLCYLSFSYILHFHSQKGKCAALFTLCMSCDIVILLKRLLCACVKIAELVFSEDAQWQSWLGTACTLLHFQPWWKKWACRTSQSKRKQRNTFSASNCSNPTVHRSAGENTADTQYLHYGDKHLIALSICDDQPGLVGDPVVSTTVTHTVQHEILTVWSLSECFILSSCLYTSQGRSESSFLLLLYQIHECVLTDWYNTISV